MRWCFLHRLVGAKTNLGSLKNRRMVCGTKNTNFVPIPGFPNGGYFRGCPDKPAPNSLFCAGCLPYVVTGGLVIGNSIQL